MNKKLSHCANCYIKYEEKGCIKKEGKSPQFCPTANEKEAIERTKVQYAKPEIRKFARMASIQEGEGYGNRGQKNSVTRPVKSRIEEIIEFAHRMKYNRLGLAFCIGLRYEANITTKILEKEGFEVVSVVCKVGCIDKGDIGIQDNQKISIGSFESMCNPIAQAEILNEAETEFNIILGLCVGHDSLFIKYSKAPTTVFAVKDRLLGHNPLAAIYSSNSYYEWLLKEKIKI